MALKQNNTRLGDEINKFLNLIIVDSEEAIRMIIESETVENDVKTNMRLINSFPNSILLDDSDEEVIEEKEENKDIWDILAEVGNQIASEFPSECDEKKCDECGSTKKFIEDIISSTIVCADCGLVIRESIDAGPEWNQYSDDAYGEKNVRCGNVGNSLFSKSNQTVIIKTPANSRINRKQKWEASAYYDNSLADVYTEIKNVCKKLNIPLTISDCACGMYKKVYDCKYINDEGIEKSVITRGDNRKSIVAACLLEACNMNKFPVDDKKIAKNFLIKRKKLTSGSKELSNLLLHSDDKYITSDRLEGMTTDEYIRSVCPRLNLGKNVIDTAIKIASNCYKLKIVADHNPKSIAAGAVCISIQKNSEVHINSKTIAKNFCTSEVTVNKIKNKMNEFSDVITDNKKVDYLVKTLELDL